MEGIHRVEREREIQGPRRKSEYMCLGLVGVNNEVVQQSPLHYGVPRLRRPSVVQVTGIQHGTERDRENGRGKHLHPHKRKTVRLGVGM